MTSGAETPPDVLADTDILAAFLLGDGPEPGVLERLLPAAFCMTTVLNAAELLGAAETQEERGVVKDLLGGLHVLGFHQRYAGAIADALRASPPGGMRAALVAAFCISNRVPLLTGAVNQYRGIPHLTIIDAGDLPENPGDLRRLLRLAPRRIPGM